MLSGKGSFIYHAPPVYLLDNADNVLHYFTCYAIASLTSQLGYNNGDGFITMVRYIDIGVIPHLTGV